MNTEALGLRSKILIREDLTVETFADLITSLSGGPGDRGSNPRPPAR